VHHARRRSAVHHQGLRQWCSRQHTLLQQARRSAVHHRRLRRGFSGPHRLLHQGVGTVHPGAFEAGCPRAAFADRLQCQRCMPRCIAENSCSSGAAERYGFALRQGRSDRRLPPLQQPHSSELGQLRAADAQSLGRTWRPGLVALEWPRRRPGRARASRARRPAMCTEACEAELSLRCLQPPPLTDHFNTLSLSLSRSVLPLLEAPADVARQRAEASVSAPEAS
jgi:hypothetical protein